MAFSDASLRALQHHLVLGDIDAAVLFELVDEPVHDDVVHVVAAQMGVAVGGHDLDDLVADLVDGDIECAATEVVDGDDLVFLLVETIGERGRCRLVDDALDVQAAILPASLVACRCESLKYAGP